MINKREWHPWFAWFPVELESGRWAWLRTVERRRYHSICYDSWYIYRERKAP